MLLSLNNNHNKIITNASKHNLIIFLDHSQRKVVNKFIPKKIFTAHSVKHSVKNAIIEIEVT